MKIFKKIILIIFIISFLICLLFFLLLKNEVSYYATFISFSYNVLYLFEIIPEYLNEKRLKKYGKKIMITPINVDMNEKLTTIKNYHTIYAKYLICSYIDEFGNEYELISEPTFKNLQHWLKDNPNTQIYGYIDQNDNTKYIIPIKQLDLKSYNCNNIYKN